ncbi:MAG: precorrin-4 C(11)-methyltransferase [Planctomycetes bacterium]|nr:precorrin-4 C(11)-methyltransferase [Planctomycetota bacterium]MCD7895572.1 precorrin-4 C(11)-methyltransferase [Planctomycetaceae bacterium]
MIWFVGAGPGDIDLITVKGQRHLREADQVIFAGSLVNPTLLEQCKVGAVIHDSAVMTLEQVIEAMRAGEQNGWTTVRLHTGDPSLYGAIREQMDALKRLAINYEIVPGVSSFSAAAAAVEAEYTLPGVSQTVILTRLAGRTPVPDGEDMATLAAHGASMAVFLSSGLLGKLQDKLLAGAYTEDTPVALVYKASWPDEQVIRCRLGDLARAGADHGIDKTALVLVGDFLGDDYERSRLYHPDFTTGFRKGTDAD